MNFIQYLTADKEMFNFMLFCLLFGLCGLAARTKTRSRVVSRHPEHGYEVRATDYSGYIHVTDQVKYDAYMQKQYDAFWEAYERIDVDLHSK